MKTHQVLLIVIIMWTSHAVPISKLTEEAKNVKKSSTPNFLTLSPASIKKIRKNNYPGNFDFLSELRRVLVGWKEAKENINYSDPSSEIKTSYTKGRSRTTNTATMMKLTDSQISQIKKNYNANFTNTDIKTLDKQMSGRSRIHNESTSDMLVWSSNGLTDEQWGKIQKNIEENNVLKYDYEDVKRDFEKNSNRTSTTNGRNRNVNTEHFIEEPKYYSFSIAEWDELKRTLHKHLTGEDEKILQFNKEPEKNTKQEGRGRTEKNEPQSPKKWSLWSSYALKPSEWYQLKENIQVNEFIINKTENNIGAIGQERSIKRDSKINGYNKNSSTKDNVNVVIIKPVTGERLYNIKKHFEWDKLLESISNKDSNAANYVSRVSDIQKNDTSFADTEIKMSINKSELDKHMSSNESKKTNPGHVNISERSINHNESTLHIHVWSSNALTEEQWKKVINNMEEIWNSNQSNVLTEEPLKNNNASFIDTKINMSIKKSELDKRMSSNESKKTNPGHVNISERSRNHNESTFHIHIWSSNALTEEQWKKFIKNIEENKNILKYEYEDAKSEFEKNDNHTSTSAHEINVNVNTEHVSEEPKYYSFSRVEWEELKQTLHKHLTDEDEKILQINKEPTKNTKQSQSRNETNESPILKFFSYWSSYTLKPSEWNQLKENIHVNEFIMNKTENNIGAISQGRSITVDSKIDGYGNKKSSTEENINVIVKPITGERSYNIEKDFELDKLFESISSKDSNEKNDD